MGLAFQSNGVSGGFESTTVLPVGGSAGWGGRGRFAADLGPWSLNLKATKRVGWFPSDQDLWTLAAQGGWHRWKVGWKGSDSDPPGRIEGAWEAAGKGAGLSWGPRKGWAGRGFATTDVGGLTLGAQVEVGRDEKGWRNQGGVSAAGKAERGRWMASWLVESGMSSPTQTVTANWKEATMEFEARWTVQGFRLGWLGPGNDFSLRLIWFF
jgi:hypothetical protein